MVGMHILKHRYDCSDDHAVEELHENAYWPCFCGLDEFQRGRLLDPTSLAKFRNRVGAKGTEQVEACLLKTWREMGLVKTKKVSMDSTAQPKYCLPDRCPSLPPDAGEDCPGGQEDPQGCGVQEASSLLCPERDADPSAVKKLCRNNPGKRERSMEELRKMTERVVKQAAGMVNSLYTRGRNRLGRKLNQLVSLGKKVVDQTREALSGRVPEKRIYSLHELQVAAIKKGKAHPKCEFGSVVCLSANEDGGGLSHTEYQHNVSDLKTAGEVIDAIEVNTGRLPEVVAADRGFSQSPARQERCRRRWKVKRLSIPRKGKHPHPDSEACWFKQAQRQRTRIEPIIGHLKSDHRMNRCRYRGAAGDTTNVAWATVAWNTKKVTELHRRREQKQGSRTRTTPKSDSLQFSKSKSRGLYPKSPFFRTD